MLLKFMLICRSVLWMEQQVTWETVVVDGADDEKALSILVDVTVNEGDSLPHVTVEIDVDADV